MSNRLPPLNALRAFNAAARHLSFTRAAEELSVTPAAISHQIKSLEAYLGVQLFRRRPQGLILTEPAQQALPSMTDGFGRIAAAVATLRRADDNEPLTVTVQPALAGKWLVPRIDQFRARHPGIEIRIDASSRLVDFHAEDIDVGIRHGLGEYPGLYVEPLPAQEVFPVCSPALLTGELPLVTPHDLRHHTLLHLYWAELETSSMVDWRAWLNTAGIDDIDSTAGPWFGQESMVLQAAAEGQGVALVRTLIAAADLAAGRVVRPFAHTLPEEFRHYFVCRPEAVDMPRVATFRRWLMEELADSGG